MSKKIRAFIGYLKVLVNGETLGGGFYRFLSVHACFLVFYGLPHVFINTMLLGQTGDVKVVVMYNATFFLGSAAAMLLAAGLLQRTDSGVTAVLGILGYNVLYLLLIVLPVVAFVVLLVAWASGGSCGRLLLAELRPSAVGFHRPYQPGQRPCHCEHLRQRRQPHHPAAGGFHHRRSGRYAGLYGGVRAVVCRVRRHLCAGAAAAQAPYGGHKVDYPRTLRAIGRNRHLLYSLAAQGCKGVREGAFTFILSIVLYQMVKNELLVGFNTFLSAAAAIASYVIASRILSLANRVRYMGIAVAVLTGIAALCILHLSPMTVILYTVVNSFFAGFLENSTYSTFLDMMQLVPEMDDHRPELLAVNDTVLELGRCVGLSIIIVMNVYVGEDVGVQVWSLLVLTLTQVGTVLLCRGAMRSAKQAAPGA